VEVYLHSPIHLHSVVLSWLSRFEIVCMCARVRVCGVNTLFTVPDDFSTYLLHGVRYYLKS
jgi:hypothetical protein